MALGQPTSTSIVLVWSPRLSEMIPRLATAQLPCRPSMVHPTPRQLQRHLLFLLPCH